MKILYFFFFSFFFQHLFAQNSEALKLIKKENYWEAISLLEKDFLENPDDSKTAFYLAICYLETKNSPKAHHIFEKIQPHADSLPDFAFWYGKNCYLNENFNTALFFLEKAKSKKRSKETQDLLQLCQNAIDLVSVKNEYVVSNLDNFVNTEKSEYGALATRNFEQIIFTRQQTPLSTLPSLHLTEEAKQIMVCKQQTDGTWQKAIRINNYETSSGMDAAVQLLDADRKMLIYQDGDLKVSEYINGEWKIPELLQEGINSTEIEKYACIFEQGKRIIFSSNQDGKNHSLDLYEAQLLADQKWGQPVSLTELNTSKDEDTPFITDNGNTLYFCSKGHNSIGGYDIFRSNYDSIQKKWSKPQNMGIPINSVADDCFLFLQGQVGYLTSNRLGGKGMEDIYAVFLFSKIKLSGKVIHRKSLQAQTNCQLIFRHEQEVFETTTNAEGLYEIALPFHKTLKMSILKNEIPVYEEDIFLRPQPKRPYFQSRNYYLSYDSLVPTPLHLESFGTIKDAKTSLPLVADLSLSKNGLLIEKLKTDTTGKFRLDIDKAKGTYSLDISAKGYLFESTQLSPTPVGKIELNVGLRAFEKNMVFVLRNMYFDTNSDKISPQSEASLQKLYNFLKQNEKLKIEISGHTDNVGDPSKNRLLSENRAKSVATYLLGKGIAADRLSSIGYGDTRPIASNDDEEDGRALNRRIEIRILEW